jgi:single-strand DNA-binding protein
MYQKVILIGNLGRDPEMRYLPDGTAVTNFSIATNRKWTDQAGETMQETLWFRISVFGRQAETCNEYLSKGRLVQVEGRLTGDPETGGPKLWTRDDGTVGVNFEVRGFNVLFLGGDSEGRADSDSYGSYKEKAVEEDEIPF